MPEKFDGQYRAFPTTHWSLVGQAGREDPLARQAALAALLTRYTPALRAYLVRKKGLTHDRAEDLVQSFLADKVLEKDLIASADRSRGKFRTFLLTALERYIISVHRYETAKKRSGGELADLAACAEPAGGEQGPDDVFDIAWARQVLSQALDRMRIECEERKRPDIWGVFEGRVLSQTLGQGSPLDYDTMVEQFGLASPAQASNVLITAKRMYARHLREVVGEYAAGEQAIEEEIQDLHKILARSRTAE